MILARRPSADARGVSDEETVARLLRLSDALMIEGRHDAAATARHLLRAARMMTEMGVSDQALLPLKERAEQLSQSLQ